MSAREMHGTHTSTWCMGCGNFGIFHALKNVLATLSANDTVLVTGIGCSSKIAQYVNGYRVESLHGRSLPVATGVKLANHHLTVIAEGGDGDGMGLGMGHFVHTARRNLDISYFVHNNQIYGLTKGQASPTTDLGTVTKFTPPPLGNVEKPVNIAHTALSMGATFVARTFTANVPHMTEMMAAAVAHRGFAVVEILQPCVSFNAVNTYAWYKQRVRDLKEMDGYDPKNQEKALALAALWGDIIPIGLFYQESRATFDGALPQLQAGPLVGAKLQQVDITPLMQEFV